MFYFWICSIFVTARVHACLVFVFFFFAEVKQKGWDLGSKLGMGLFLVTALFGAAGYLLGRRSPPEENGSAEGEQTVGLSTVVAV